MITNSIIPHPLELCDQYYARFRKRVFTLLFMGYSQMTIDLSNAIEEDVSGKLAECVENYLNSPTAPCWVEKYSVSNEHPFSPNGEVGKKRKRLDIRFRCSEQRPAFLFVFESKRLYSGTEPVDYFGKEGMQRFLQPNNYPTNAKGEAAMLGYVQSEDVQHWARWLATQFQNKQSNLHVSANSSLEKHSVIPELTDVFCTRHEPPTGKQITLFHVLLFFGASR